MEGVNEDVENWSVSQVLSWLKSTNDGQFDQFVPIFKQHQIYGDALLSLTNDILRDELNIIAYGARHALLKAISNLKQSYQSRQELQSKLNAIKFKINHSTPRHIKNKNKNHHHRKTSHNQSHRKASMSSICSKASIQTKTSHTYCIGDLTKDRSDTINGIDDNWENLNTMAKHGVVDASEYLKQAKLIVKAVTGTTIKLTRKGSGDNDIDNVYKSGFFEFEDNIPDWNTIESQEAIKYEWNTHKLGWDKSYIAVKIAENPFSRGSLRVSYYCLDLTEHVKQSKHLSFDLSASLNRTTPKSLISPTNSVSIKVNTSKCIKGYHSQSNSNLKQFINHNNNIPIQNKSNINKKNKELESMSVPAEVALGRHSNIDHERDHMSFPYFSPSLPEAEDEKIDGSQSQIDHKEHDIMDDNDEKAKDVMIPTADNNDGDHEEKQSVPSPITSIDELNEESRTFTATISTKTNLQKGDLVARLLGFESRYGGNLIVAKQSIDLTESVATYFNDVRTQSVAQLFANEYNKYNPPKKVAFIKASVIQLLESESEQFFCVEDYLHGAYMKHLDNYGGDEGIRNTPSAFAHFTYEASEHRLLVCDIQGVGDLYTDPQIHTCDGKGFGKGNLGIDGMIKFLQTHSCNAICQHLRLDIVNPKPMVYGTRPAKMYMDKKNIKIIDHIDQLNNDEYHKMPKIPINTLNDYYLREIYKVDKYSKKLIDKKSICEINPNTVDMDNKSINHQDNDSDIMSDDDINTINTRYSRHQSNVNINKRNDSEDNYNPLTPLINQGDDIEDTKCGFCSCVML